MSCPIERENGIGIGIGIGIVIECICDDIDEIDMERRSLSSRYECA